MPRRRRPGPQHQAPAKHKGEFTKDDASKEDHGSQDIAQEAAPRASVIDHQTPLRGTHTAAPLSTMNVAAPIRGQVRASRTHPRPPLTSRGRRLGLLAVDVAPSRHPCQPTPSARLTRSHRAASPLVALLERATPRPQAPRSLTGCHPQIWAAPTSPNARSRQGGRQLQRPEPPLRLPTLEIQPPPRSTPTSTAHQERNPRTTFGSGVRRSGGKAGDDGGKGRSGGEEVGRRPDSAPSVAWVRHGRLEGGVF
ncbi:hypothetical protein BRADI_3g43411v3 [Brachypodium distachyon]|uniref:Uncharacterized protein n=1 Tax=Brachypodium distachyon TaxID=15368 RepID=A0A0Q3FIL0_BRADI|nr:hypothetical protein BRADI_3g43411v3 [Brachypodium distachyon]